MFEFLPLLFPLFTYLLFSALSRICQDTIFAIWLEEGEGEGGVSSSFLAGLLTHPFFFSLWAPLLVLPLSSPCSSSLLRRLLLWFLWNTSHLFALTRYLHFFLSYHFSIHSSWRIVRVKRKPWGGRKMKQHKKSVGVRVRIWESEKEKRLKWWVKRGCLFEKRRE